MAFSTSNVQKNYVGKLRMTYGQWSSLVGDAAGTIGVEGGQVYGCFFSAQTPAGTTYSPDVTWNPSTSGGVTTVTISSPVAVTNGNFMIIHA